MITAAFDLAAWTLLFFIVGMIKPRWALFFLKTPDRFLIAAITAVLVMITGTLYGEGHKRELAAKEEIAKLASPEPATGAVPVPVPAPTTAPVGQTAKP